MGSQTTYTINNNGAAITVGTLTVYNTNNEYNTVIAGAGLIFDNGANEAVFNENLGTGTSTTSRTRITAPITLNSNLTINQNHNLTRQVESATQQVIAGPTKVLTKDGLGTYQFEYSGASDAFQGTLHIVKGGVRVINGSGSVNTTFNQANGIVVEDGGQFQMGNGITSFHIGSGAEVTLNGTGNSNTQNSFREGALRFEQTDNLGLTATFDNPVRLHTLSSIYVTSDDMTAVMTQEIRGDGNAGLNKGGLGVLKLATTSNLGNTYAGRTNVSKGTLVVNNTDSTTSGVGSGDVIIGDTGSGAALGGTGYIGKVSAPSNVSLTGDATSATGARLFPGDVSGSTGAGGLTTSIGTLTIHGNLSFDSLSSLNIDLNHSAADKVIDDGTITLGGAGLNFSLGTPDLDGTESFTLIDNQGVGSIVGEFGKINGVAGTYSEGSTITVGTQSYKLTYAGGIGNNDVMLLPVALPGDFNGDSKINAADYVTWRKNDGTASGYAAWRENFSQSSAAAPSFAEAAAVPEPATLAGVILVSPFIAAGLARRKSGRSRKC